MRQRSFATVLVGKSALLREGITQILSAAADFHIVASASCVNDSVLTSLPRQQSILLIIAAGDDLDSASGQLQLFKSRHPAARVAVLADHAQAVDIVSAFHAGANAFFIKVAHCDAFIKSLELVMLGETILPMEILSTILDRADDDEHDHEKNSVARPVKNTIGELSQPQSRYTPRLSVRQRCILNCLIEGHSNKVIARKIDIAEATVKVHIKSILRKIGVRNRTQAAIWAMSNGSPISTMDDSSCAPAKADLRPPLGSHLIPTLPVTQQSG
jgi:two-component system, NarL family, nitrate/nitrite response regulator NarL